MNNKINNPFIIPDNGDIATNDDDELDFTLSIKLPRLLNHPLHCFFQQNIILAMHKMIYACQACVLNQHP